MVFGFGLGCQVAVPFTFDPSSLPGVPASKRFPCTTATPPSRVDLQLLVDGAFPVRPFRFLDLPTELRLEVYNYVLAPTGTISLAFGTAAFSFDAPRRRATGLWSNLFRVCRQIYMEAEPVMYAKNNAILDFDNVSARTTAPGIYSSRMYVPSSAYPKLKHVTLALAFGDPNFSIETPLSMMDWRQLQWLSGLKTLCIMAFHNAKEAPNVDWAKSLLTEILERVPQNCKIEFGPVTREQENHLVSYMARPCRSSGIIFGVMTLNIVATDKQLLAGAMDELQCLRGSKNGSKVDFHWKKRSVNAL